ncbi:MAG: peroxiredoxin [Pseudorhodobacter sp.]
MSTLAPGDLAPDFTLPRDGGGVVSLSSLRPGRTLVYFYPRDDTSGCTIEAKDFTALAEDFNTLGVRIVGISRDSVASHDKFIRKHDLGIILASDEEGATCEAYGVWVEKNMYGRKSMGIERATFLIDGTGKIERIWRKVRAKGHAEAVLAAARPQ